MTFCEKLDLLMKIANTTNSALARSVSLDASFVSRLRRGTRTPAKNENYIMAMAAFFARNCSKEYQKAALGEALKVSLGDLTTDAGEVTGLIYKWLQVVEKTDNTKAIKTFVDNIAQFRFKTPPKVPAVNVSEINVNTTSDAEVFYGVEGKRNAVIAFFSLILRDKSPQTLLLYSDENIDWLIEDPEFTAKWAALFYQIIMRGNKVKIIHSVSRSLDELLSAIRKWLPIYMTGAVEPYYYPKIRDRVFKRTLFIAPHTVAVVSNSVGNETSNAANFLFTNKNTITALSKEYTDFLSLCRPLMRIFTPTSREGFLSVVSEFDNQKAHGIVKTDVPSNVTMPLDVVENVISRVESAEKDQILTYQQARIKMFEVGLREQKFTEVITMPDLEQIQNGRVMLNFSDIFGSTVLFYTPSEFSRHLQNVIRLLDTYENYNVYLARTTELPGCMIYAKEDVGVIIGKTSPPSVAFATNESNISAAFWEYVSLSLHKETKAKMHRKRSIAEFEKIISLLEADLHISNRSFESQM